jgi:hypothetical protein
VYVVSGRFGCVVMCTVHILCGPEFWVKVVRHKFRIYFAVGAVEKVEKHGIVENADTV